MGYPRRDLPRWAALLAAMALGLLILAADQIAQDRPVEELGPTPSTEDVARLAEADSFDRFLDRVDLHESYVRAFELAVRQLRIRSEILGPRHPDTMTSLHRTGTIAHLGGDQNIAELVIESALELRREVLGPDHPEVAETLYLRGLVARYVQERELSLQCYREALEILDGADGRHVQLIAAIGQAEASWLRGIDPEQAVSRYEEALALRRRSLPRPDISIADNMTWLAWNLVAVGRSEQALRYIAQAESELLELGLPDHFNMAVLRNLEADLLAVDGKWEEAYPAYRETTRLRELARDKHLPGFSRRKSPLDGYDAQALYLLMRGKPEQAWSTLQHSKSNVNRDFVTFGQWKERSPQSYPAIRALREEYLELRARLRATSGRVRADDDAWEILVRLLEVRAGLYEHEDRYLARHRPAPVRLQDVQARLSDRTAYVGVLEVQIGAQRRGKHGPMLHSTWFYVIRQDHPIVWIPIAEANTAEEFRELDRPGRQYSDLIHRAAGWRLRVEHDERLASLAREMGRRRFDPLRPHLEGVDTIVVEGAASSMLERLKGPDGRDLIDDFSVAYVHSATAFLLLTASGTAEPGSSALTIGDPLLRDLPYTSVEVRNVSSMFSSSTLLQGADASERRLDVLATSGELSSFGVIHVATHTLISGQPERCALVLSRPGDASGAHDDGFLDTVEILYGWELNADIVTLSGCQTAIGSGFSRGEFIGFGQALHAVGARSVIGNLWKVEDWAASMLMTRFYENLTGSHAGPRMGFSAEPMPKALALREAKLWLRDYTADDGSHPFAHPVYWSGFVLTGSPE